MENTNYSQNFLGERIRDLRKKKKITQQELADSVGLSQNHLSHIETGFKNTNVQTLCNLCNALDVTPDELLIIKEEEKG